MGTTKKTGNMTLLELQGILGDRVRVTLDESLTAEEREKLIKDLQDNQDILPMGRYGG